MKAGGYQCGRVSPGRSKTSLRNASPRTSKLRYIRRFGVAGGERDRPVERAGHHMRHLAVELGGEARRRLTNQIGLADAREEAGERRQPAGLRLAAGDPEDIAEARQRLRG